jgi:dephospho-CoA kinase
MRKNSIKIGTRSTYFNDRSILVIKVKRQLKKERLKKRKQISERRR